MDSDVIKRASELAVAGRKGEARRLLEPLLRAEPTNIPAWLWYAETFTTDAQRIQVLEMCYRYNPKSTQIKRALAVLRARRARGITVPPGVPASFEVRTRPNPRVRLRQVGETGSEPVAREPARPEARSAPQAVRRQKKRAVSSTFWVWAVLFLLAAVLGVGWALTRPPDPAAFRRDQPGEYYLYVPQAYRSDGPEWPVVVGIHAAGESGIDCWNTWQKYAEAEGFILVCPSFGSDGAYQGGEVLLINIMDQVRREYRAQPRFFLAGFFAGGSFVQGFTFRFPQYVNAAALLSASQYEAPKPEALGVPFLVVTGVRDSPMNLQLSQQFVSTLEQAGFTVQYRSVSGMWPPVKEQAVQQALALFRQVK